MKKIILTLLIACCLQSVRAQTVNFIPTYSIGFPMGNLGDYIEKTSFRGACIEITKRQKPNVDIGIEAAWNLFYERVDSKVYTEGTASISGVQFRYTNTVPLLATGKYYMRTTSGKAVHPYLGLGIGTLFVNRSTDFGLYRITNDTWQFCLRPELGIAIRNRDKPAIIIGAKYYASFNNSDLDSQPYFSINVGMALPGF